MVTEEFSMNMILRAGNAKGYLHEALAVARKGEFSQAERHLREASDELLEAHKQQTQFIQQDAQGGLKQLSVLLIHAQDHLMTVMSEKSLVEEMIEMYRSQQVLEERVEYLFGLTGSKKD